MKISIKYLLLFFAVVTMSVVACSDDDGDEPKPATNNNNMPNDTLPPAGTEFFNAIANGEAVSFTNYSAEIVSTGPTDILEIKGSKSSPAESIRIETSENFTGTTNSLAGTEKITYTRGGTLFSGTQGQLTISRNDSVVEGTFRIDEVSNIGSDTLKVTNGKFYIKKQ